MLLDDEQQRPASRLGYRGRGLGSGLEGPLGGGFAELLFRHAEILGAKMMQMRAGASGYSYKEWKGNFYPEGIRPDAMLAWYAERLPTVEINNTFYRMPKTSVLESWAQSTPEGFRFAIKASRRITHMARLKAESAAEGG